MNTKFIEIVDSIATCATSFIITTLVLAAVGFSGAPLLAPYCAIIGLVVMEYWTKRAIQDEVAAEYKFLYLRYALREAGKKIGWNIYTV